MTFATDELVASCEACLREPDPRAAIRDVLAGVMARHREVADALRPERAGITLLHRTPELTVIDLVWAPGMRLYAHDHRMWASIAVYTGQEDNEFFRRAPDGKGLVPANGRRLEEGDLLTLGDDAVHAVANPGTKPTGAIHVYGGDFVAQPRSQWPPPDLREEPYDMARVTGVFDDANRAWHGDR